MIILKSKVEFNERLIKQGYSKKAFAEKVSISETALHQILNRKQSPRPETAKRIYDGLGLKFDDLFKIDKQDKELAR